ncbi:UNVERIFIED_CONTAM: S-protein24 [Sesamum latifolium]|uniref:S-protein homolog n=1 Tax=Sesamum latifolium TaxID=2727402 RepID=A0AAW2Y599_9LAMI
MNVHCQSREDDLGHHILEVEETTEWSFNVNIWETTLFYCDVQWGDHNWHHFDAYDGGRDKYRCSSICRWMISKDGLLYGYNEESGYWEWYPLIAIT